MPTKRFSEAEIMRLPKRRRANYRAERGHKDRERLLNGVDEYSQYLEDILQKEHPEKELGLTVWDDSITHFLGILAVARGMSLKCKQRSLDRRRDPTELLRVRFDLLDAHIDFDPIKLEQDNEYYAQKMSEWAAKKNLFPKTQAGRELRKSLETIEPEG